MSVAGGCFPCQGQPLCGCWGRCGVPSARGAHGALGEGGVAAAGPWLPDNGVHSLLCGRCGVSSRDPGSVCVPGAAELGCWGGLPGRACERWAPARCPEPRPPRWCRWLLAWLPPGTSENFPSGPSAMFRCNVLCCPNPINSALCFPHLKSLIRSRSWAGRPCCSCTAAAGAVPVTVASLQGCGLVWERSMGFGFLSHFQISGVEAGAAARRWRSLGERSCPWPPLWSWGIGDSLQRTCKTLIAASVPRLTLVVKV